MHKIMYSFRRIKIKKKKKQQQQYRRQYNIWPRYLSPLTQWHAQTACQWMSGSAFPYTSPCRYRANSRSATFVLHPVQPRTSCSANRHRLTHLFTTTDKLDSVFWFFFFFSIDYSFFIPFINAYIRTKIRLKNAKKTKFKITKRVGAGIRYGLRLRMFRSR
jgi:hypothetical protein